MKRNLPPHTIGLFLATGGLMITAAQAQQRPNILFIMSDDHASRAISCYGSGLNQTPNIDRLAQDGVRFTHACVGNAISGPARATLLTGKFSHRNGFMTNENTFDGSQQTFSKLLQKAGYETAIVGKWHMVSEPTGFNYWNILVGQGEYYDPVFIENGKRNKIQGYVTEIITRESIAWLESRKDTTKPFCLLVHHKAPHRNWLPAPSHRDDNKDKQFPIPPNFHDDYAGRESTAGAQQMQIARDMLPGSDLKITKSDSADLRKLNPRQQAEWKYQRYLHDYLATIASVDESVGVLIDYLKANKLYDNTLIVYTSDQGFYTGEHGWFDKRFMYEESLITPLIIHPPLDPHIRTSALPHTRTSALPHTPAPALPPTSTSLVQNTDFAPTILDYAGLPVPQDMQGISLRPILNDPKVKLRDAVYYHYFEYPGEHKVKRHYGIRTEQYKLIHFYHDVDVWECYDLASDPQEMKNLIRDPASKSTIDSLKIELADLRKQYAEPTIEEELSMGFVAVNNKARGKAVVLKTAPSPKYSKGEIVLNDGVVRTITTYNPGDMTGWQAFHGNDLLAGIDLNENIRADSIWLSCLKAEPDWIFLPKKVMMEISKDGKEYHKLNVITYPYSSYGDRTIYRYAAPAGKAEFRYLRVKAMNYGPLPDTHPAKGNPAWLFVDEIIVE